MPVHAAPLAMLALVLGMAAGPSFADDWDTCLGARGEPAIAACTRIADNPAEPPERRAGALHNRADAYRDAEEFDKAIADYSAVLDLDPTLAASALFGRGFAYYEKEAFDGAIADLNEAIRLEPADARAFMLRGNAYRGKD